MNDTSSTTENSFVLKGDGLGVEASVGVAGG